MVTVTDTAPGTYGKHARVATAGKTPSERTRARRDAITRHRHLLEHRLCGRGHVIVGPGDLADGLRCARCVVDAQAEALAVDTAPPADADALALAAALGRLGIARDKAAAARAITRARIIREAHAS